MHVLRRGDLRCLRSIVYRVAAKIGVRFIAVTRNIDTDKPNPMARFLLRIMAAFAGLEHGIIRERVVAGVKAAEAGVPAR